MKDERQKEEIKGGKRIGKRSIEKKKQMRGRRGREKKMG
jgi:hypothetical protein